MDDDETTLEQQRLEERRRRVERLDLPLTAADFKRIVERDLLETRALRATRAWWERGETARPWLLLFGSPGTGKTLAGVAALVQCEHGARYVGARRIEQVFGARYGVLVEAQQELQAANLLVVDDVGRELDRNALGAALVELLDVRRRSACTTIVITNCDRAAFNARYCDPRLLSRLQQSARWAACTGPDLRRSMP